jgi:hypothetical protein
VRDDPREVAQVSGWALATLVSVALAAAGVLACAIVVAANTVRARSRPLDVDDEVCRLSLGKRDVIVVTCARHLYAERSKLLRETFEQVLRDRGVHNPVIVLDADLKIEVLTPDNVSVFSREQQRSA